MTQFITPTNTMAIWQVSAGTKPCFRESGNETNHQWPAMVYDLQLLGGCDIHVHRNFDKRCSCELHSDSVSIGRQWISPAHPVRNAPVDEVQFLIPKSCKHYSQHSFVHVFHVRRCLLQYPQVTHGKWVTTFYSVSDKLSVFTATVVTVCAYSVLWFSFSRYSSLPTAVWYITNTVSCSYSMFFSCA